MKRMLVLAALALVAPACGDEADDAERRDAPIEGGDAAVASPHVANVGDPCRDDQACQGSRAECMTRSSTSSTYGGGYCTADCATDAECGPDGLCPVSEAERLDPSYDFANSWPRICFRGCIPGAASGCRAGYRCLSLSEAYARPAAPLPMKRPVCIPLGSANGAVTEMDAGPRTSSDAKAIFRRRDASSIAATMSDAETARNQRDSTRQGSSMMARALDAGT